MGSGNKKFLKISSGATWVPSGKKYKKTVARLLNVDVALGK